MTQTVGVSRHIRCPAGEASAVVTDPRNLLSKIETISRCRFIESGDDGELWDVYLDSGTVHLGGRVLITSPDKNRMQWKSVSDAVWSLATWKPSPRKSVPSRIREVAGRVTRRCSVRSTG
jgi:hypothetical protein